jgi:hypothetical protein
MARPILVTRKKEDFPKELTLFNQLCEEIIHPHTVITEGAKKRAARIMQRMNDYAEVINPVFVNIVVQEFCQ